MKFSEAFAYRADYLGRIEEIEAPFVERLNVLRQMMVGAELLNKWFGDKQGGDVEWLEQGIYFRGYTDMEEHIEVPESALDLTVEEYPAWIEAEIKRQADVRKQRDRERAKQYAEQQKTAKLEKEQREYEIYLKVKAQVEKGAQRGTD